MTVPYHDRATEMELAERLRQRRQELFYRYSYENRVATTKGTANPYSQTSVGACAGVSPTVVFFWENGYRFPMTQEKWEAWAQALGAEIEFRLEAV